MAVKTQYDQIIPTYVLRAHFKFLLEGVRSRQDDPKTTVDELYRLQGESRLLRGLDNIAETLTIIQEAMETEEKEKERASS